MSYSGFTGLNMAVQGYTGYIRPCSVLALLEYSGLYWAIQGFTWLHWAIHIHMAILGCTWLWMLRYSELFYSIKGYIGLHLAIKGNTVSAAAAIAVKAKVWLSEWVSQWVSESVTVLDLERLAPLKIVMLLQITEHFQLFVPNKSKWPFLSGKTLEAWKAAAYYYVLVMKAN